MGLSGPPVDLSALVNTDVVRASELIGLSPLEYAVLAELDILPAEVRHGWR
jgi:hypothetical protein